CNEECTAGTYGQDCKGVCDCANGARCFNIDGSCLCEPGFSGPQCRNRMCGPGNYGMHCEHKCLCEEKHTLSCHPMKGECTCQPGWAGLFCNETCPHGFYGHGCVEPCPHCSEPCPEGLWGPHCNHTCSMHCLNSDTCLRKTGDCVCRPGYWGATCQNNSSEQAGSVMVPLPPGERESWGAIGGIVVLVLLVVLLLALLLLYRRRQKDKQNNTPTVSFSTSRTVNSEYAVPGVKHNISSTKTV
ncbi:hypothetical protein GOODEAATRI_009269, partial [Goodea atripinnis]